jgi:hypothetical protein
MHASAGIDLRSVKHVGHSASVLAFWVCVTLGCACSSLYHKSTPNMYATLYVERVVGAFSNVSSAGTNTRSMGRIAMQCFLLLFFLP